MNNEHAVLGYGRLGSEIVETLKQKNIPYRILSTNKTDDPQSHAVDALDKDALIAATKDLSHVYVTIGLPYKIKVWQEKWPIIIANVIEAAKANKFKIIFFDNVYLYGPVPLQNPITEEHTVSPPSKKGLVRKQLVEMLLEAHKNGGIELLIGRSPDFYGPGVINSLLYVSAIQNMLKGKPVQFVGNPDTKHNYLYVQDAARALVTLALDTSAYGQTWHLPTNKATLTTRELLKLAADELNIELKVQVLSPAALTVLQLFIPILKEVREMTYQTTDVYNFSSDKFMKAYPDFAITSYEEGIKQTMEFFKAGRK